MNSTTEAKVGWVSDPNGRGTAGLLWGCFVTLYLSTWAMMHPNLPGKHDSSLKIFGRKISYMALAIIAPEFVAFSAFNDFQRIWKAKKINNLQNPETKSQWSLKQHFFLDMGGFVLRPYPNKPNIIVPDREPLIELFSSGELSLPDLTDADIEDRNKSNWFTKSLTIIQVSYFIIQLIGRAAQSLPTTTLELFTLSIVILSVLTYAAWWSKPFDIQRPIVLSLRPNYQDRVGEIKDIKRKHLILNNPYPRCLQNQVGVIILTLSFAAIHLIGWNFSFPTQKEQTIWRVSSVLSGALPLLFILNGSLMNYFQEKEMLRLEKGHEYINLIIIMLYFANRIILGVEMLVNLRSVPPGVYKTPEWSDYFPWFS